MVCRGKWPAVAAAVRERARAGPAGPAIMDVIVRPVGVGRAGGGGGDAPDCWETAGLSALLRYRLRAGHLALTRSRSPHS